MNTIVNTKRYIQCVFCENFVNMRTYNAVTGNYKCEICGPFSKAQYENCKRIKDSNGKFLKCEEIKYGKKK